MRVMAEQLLDAAGVPWTEVFVGGGVAAVVAVVAAVMPGLGVAALAPRMVPLGAVDVGHRSDSPTCPASRSRSTRASRTDGRPRDALAKLSAAYRSAVRG